MERIPIECPCPQPTTRLRRESSTEPEQTILAPGSRPRSYPPAGGSALPDGAGGVPVLGGAGGLTAPDGAGGALCGAGSQAANAALTDVALLLPCPLVSISGPLPDVFTVTPCSRMHVTNFAG